MPRAASQLAMGPLVLLFYIQPQQVTLPGSHLSLKGTTSGSSGTAPENDITACTQQIILQ